MNRALQITIAVVLNCLCGILVVFIALLTDNGGWAAITALILGVSGGIFVSKNTIPKACMFGAGEVFSLGISLFTRTGDPFSWAGSWFWVLPLLGIFIAGLLVGKLIRRRIKFCRTQANRGNFSEFR